MLVVFNFTTELSKVEEARSHTASWTVRPNPEDRIFYQIHLIFDLLVKFGHTVQSSGHKYWVIRFLFIRSSGFGLMYVTPLPVFPV